MTDQNSTRGLRASAGVSLPSVGLGADKGCWLLVVGALLVLIVLRKLFSGALGD